MFGANVGSQRQRLLPLRQMEELRHAQLPLLAVVAKRGASSILPPRPMICVLHIYIYIYIYTYIYIEREIYT